MSISISSVGSSVSFAPTLELPRTQVKTAEQKAAIDQLAASLPGNSGQTDSRPQEIRQQAADIERVSQAFNRKLQFVVDQQSHEVTVKVIDAETDKVIKVLPPEELQRLHRKLKETIGFLFNELV
ncbi:MAG: flagellar protein FlaG [Treponema sp.]|jgi:flagellar protein FlaG|nr:flagellar protein FlaG [Treponema sp.]